MRTYIYIAFLFLGSTLLAQPAGRVTPLTEPGVQVYTPVSPSSGEVKPREAFSPEEIQLCLFRAPQLLEAYNQMLALRPFYERYQGSEIWKATMEGLLDDRRTKPSPACFALEKLFPDETLPPASAKVNYRSKMEQLTGRELGEELSFCLNYLGLDYLDHQLWEAYFASNAAVVQAVSQLEQTPIRLKAWIIAKDVEAKLCRHTPGLHPPSAN